MKKNSSGCKSPKARMKATRGNKRKRWNRLGGQDEPVLHVGRERGGVAGGQRGDHQEGYVNGGGRGSILAGPWGP